MKSLTRLWQELAEEIGQQCSASVSMDVKTVYARVENEGFSFLTITLPAFGADFERSLDLGGITSSLFIGYARTGGLPRFLSGFLRRIFDSRTGSLLDSPDIRSISGVRQLCHLFKKVEAECTQDRINKAIDSYVQCEKEVNSFELPAETPALLKVFTFLFGDVLSALDRKIQSHSLRPSHGPGSTADRKVGNEKFIQTEWTDRLEYVFPFGEFALSSWRYFKEFQPTWLTVEDERPVKVILVPKTLKTPRVIAVEPTCMQYMQQAVSKKLVELLELDGRCKDLIGFTDQAPNRALAQEGSRNGSLATLDLSEASDRVSWKLVQHLFSSWTNVLDALDATRSRSANLPQGRGIITLSKFASMGSALCFPVEAMVFTSIAVLGVLDGQRANTARVSSLSGIVRVYGDDIIVPADSAVLVEQLLVAFGLKVNSAKSFWTGRFRESCGGDYYNGEDVTPIRCKSLWPSTKRDAKSVTSWVHFRNSLHENGYTSTANWLKNELEGLLGPLPYLSSTSSALGWTDEDGIPDYSLRVRWNSKLHRVEVRSYSLVSKNHEYEIRGPWALQKCLSDDWSDPTSGEHLKLYGRSSSVCMKKKWVEALAN